MRRDQVGVLLVVTSGLFSVLLAVAVNVATGGRLPDPLTPYAWLAWPVVGALALVGVALALWQHRLAAVVTTTPVAPVPRELPGAPALFGLAEDLRTVGRALDAGARVVVLAAAPGSGKTSLALRVAHDARHRFPDGQLYAALRGASADPVPPEAVLGRFLRALGRGEDERRGTVEELGARFRSAVAERKVLVLLDDARDAAQVEPLLAGGAGCLTVITSRRLLADLPGATALAIGGLRPHEALALLAATAGEERIAADPDGARRLVAVCGGLPLAVRLIGGRLAARTAWTPSALADRLDDEERRLAELRLGDVAVRTTFRTAYDELPEPDRLVFRRAAAHPGAAFSLDAATARCGLDEPTVAAALDRLTEAFLVDSPAPDWYKVHDLLRLFAMEMLEAQETPGDRIACLVRQVDWLRRPGLTLAAERDNVLSVLRTTVDAGLAEPAWDLVNAIHPVLTAADDHSYRLRLWQAGEAAAVLLGDDVRRLRALRWISHSYGIAGQVRRELETAEEAMTLAERSDSPWETAQSVRRVGDALRMQGRFVEAEVTLTRAMTLFVELGEVGEEVDVRVALGTLYNTFWKPELSTPMFERALELLPPDESSIRGWTVLGLGLAYRFGGRHDESAALTDQAFANARRVGDDFLLGYCLQERGWRAEQAGRLADAERDFQEMLAIFERIRHGAGIGGAHQALGVIADKQGRFEVAVASFDAATAQYERLGDRVHTGEAMLHRAATLQSLGRQAEASKDRQRAEALIGDAPLHHGPLLLARLPQPGPAPEE